MDNPRKEAGIMMIISTGYLKIRGYPSLQSQFLGEWGDMVKLLSGNPLLISNANLSNSKLPKFYFSVPNFQTASVKVF